MPTSTLTKTKTRTKLLVATLALAAAGGLAFIFAPPSLPPSPSPTNPPVNGVCGTTTTVELTPVAPTSGLCSLGTASAVSTNFFPVPLASGVFGLGVSWTWTCTGYYGGGTASCIKNIPAVTTPGICGTATSYSTSVAPTTNLCYVGKPSSVISSVDSGVNYWAWNCTGYYGGAIPGCRAKKIITATPVLY